MPIYEFRCEPCNHRFETLVRRPTDTAHCPQCGGIELSKQLSVPAAAQTGHAGASLPVSHSSPQDFGCGPGQCRTGMCSFD